MSWHELLSTQWTYISAIVAALFGLVMILARKALEDVYEIASFQNQCSAELENISRHFTYNAHQIGNHASLSGRKDIERVNVIKFAIDEKAYAGTLSDPNVKHFPRDIQIKISQLRLLMRNTELETGDDFGGLINSNDTHLKYNAKKYEYYYKRFLKIALLAQLIADSIRSLKSNRFTMLIRLLSARTVYPAPVDPGWEGNKLSFVNEIDRITKDNAEKLYMRHISTDVADLNFEQHWEKTDGKTKSRR